MTGWIPIFLFISLAFVANPIYDMKIQEKNSNPTPSSPKLSQIIEINGTLVIETDRIQMHLDLLNFGRITKLYNKQTGQEFSFTANHGGSLWFVQLIDNMWLSPNSAQSFDYSIVGVRAVLTYTLSLQSQAMVVVVTIQLDNPSPGINLKIDIQMKQVHSGIYRTFFPAMTNIDGWANNEGAEQIAIPEREGWIVDNAINSIVSRSYGASYPGTLSMQFLLYNEPGVGGFYFAAHDSTSRNKGVELFAESSNSIKANWFHYSKEMNYEAANNFTMDYWMVIDGYSGITWAEGANLYKSWATQQWYVSKGIVASRNDTPLWLKEIDYIWKVGSYVTNQNTGNIFNEGETAANVKQFTSELSSYGLSTNFLLEWWGWSRDGFDRGYPEYYPTRDPETDVIAAIQSLNDDGAYVQLYFNGRLVDVSTATYSSNLQYMTGYKDNIYTETYTPYLTAAVADPSSSWWRDTVLNFTSKAVMDLGADVVFLDQIAVAAPKFDYRNVSTHPPGSGTWWQESQNSLLEYVGSRLRTINPDVAMSSENIIETYLNSFDIFWNYQTNYDLLADWFPSGYSIPLFSYIFHKYTLFNGRSDVYPGNVNHYLWAVSEELLRGYIPGGSVLSLPSKHRLSPLVFQLLKNSYETRKIGNYRFFRDGDLLAPTIWQRGSQITINEGSRSITVSQGAIQGFSWTSGKSSDYAITFVNRGLGSITWTGNLSDFFSQWGISDAGEMMIKLVRNGVNETLFTFPTNNIDINLAAGDVVVLWFSSNHSGEITPSDDSLFPIASHESTTSSKPTSSFPEASKNDKVSGVLGIELLIISVFVYKNTKGRLTKQ